MGTLCLLAIFGFGSRTFAANVVRGVALKYRHVSVNTYMVIVDIYGNCGSTSYAEVLSTATPEICIYNDTSYLTSINLTLAPPQILEYGCASGADSTNCMNTAMPYPGIMKYEYTGIVTLPSPGSHYWRFIFTGNLVSGTATRLNSLTNIAATTSTIGLVDTLDNTWHDNTSPNLTAEPQIEYCVGIPDSFDPAPVDPDGDSLAFALVDGTNGTGVCPTASVPDTVAYLSGYSHIYPLETAGFGFIGSNGIMDFLPTIVQNAMVKYNIREYRNDTFMGTSQREYNFLVTSACSPVCMDTLPLRVVSPQVAEQPLAIFPNPAYTNFSITTSEAGRHTATVTDMLGTVVARAVFEGRLEISTAGWSRGVYAVHTQEGAGKGWVTRLVVE